MIDGTYMNAAPWPPPVTLESLLEVNAKIEKEFPLSRCRVIFVSRETYDSVRDACLRPSDQLLATFTESMYGFEMHVEDQYPIRRAKALGMAEKLKQPVAYEGQQADDIRVIDWPPKPPQG